MLLDKVEGGEQLIFTLKKPWERLIERAKYSKAVVEGMANPRPDLPIMTKREVRRVTEANKKVQAQGFNMKDPNADD